MLLEEFQDGSHGGNLGSKWGDFSNSESPCCPDVSPTRIQFSQTYGFMIFKMRLKNFMNGIGGCDYLGY